MFRNCQSYSDQSLCISELADACQQLNVRFGYPDQDARTVVLNNLIAIAGAGQMVLNLMDSWHKGDEIVRQVIPQLIGLKTVTVDGVKNAGDNLNLFSRLGFAVLGQFQIENAIRNIGRELGVDVSSTGFYPVASNVLSRLNISTDKMDVLNTPARIRNSLHANGIHHRSHPSEKESVTIGGVIYTFKDGQRVSCAAWEHIAHAFEHSVQVLAEIFETSEVKGLSTPIKDQYAWEIGGGGTP